MSFVRFEAAEPNARGAHVGVFALANGLGRAGRLSAEDAAWWSTQNAELDQAYPVPDAALFSGSASCWFRASAVDLLLRTRSYVDLVERYGFEVREVWSDDPGQVLYADDVQVVVSPRAEG